MTEQNAGARRYGIWIVLITAFAALVLLLWLPFGIKTTGIMEEWAIIHDYFVPNPSERSFDVGWVITSGGLRMRPLTLITFMAANTAFPDSFIGYNLIVMALFFARGILVYAILIKLLPRQRVFAFMTAFLFVIFPADDGLFTFRAMNVHTAVCAWLLALYMLLSYWQNPRWWKMVISWIGLIVCLFTYELGYPLALATPLILPWWEKRFTRRMIRVSLLWWVAPIFTFAYAAYQFVQPGESYQSWALMRSGINSPSLLQEAIDMVVRAYNYHFYTGWAAGISSADLADRLTWLGFGIGVVAIIAARQIQRRQPDTSIEQLSGRRIGSLFFIGLVIILLGSIMFLITPYRYLTWRTYYFSGLGGALCVSSLVYLLTRRRQWLYIAVMGVFIGLAGIRALNQHGYYVELSRNEQRLLRGIAGAAPRILDPSGTTLVVVDETGRYNNNWSLGTSYLVENALRVVYNDYTMNAILCHFDRKTGEFTVLPELHERCAFDSSGVTLFRDGSAAEQHPYSRVVIIRFTDEGALVLETIPDEYTDGSTNESNADYTPLSLIDAAAPLPPRYYTMFDVE